MADLKCECIPEPSSRLLLPLPLPRRPADSPSTYNTIHDIFHALAVPHAREQRRPAFPHRRGVSAHHVERRTDVRRQIRLEVRMVSSPLYVHACETHFVDDEEIRLGDPRPAFPRDLVPSTHVNDVDDVVRELPRVVC